MATVKGALALYDGMSGPLKNIHTALNIVLNSFEAVQDASGNVMDTSAIQQAREELARARASWDSMEESIRDADQAQEKFNDGIREGSGAADKLADKFKKLKSVAAALGIGAGIKKLVELSDSMTSTTARLSLIADDGGTVAALGQQIMGLEQEATVVLDTAGEEKLAQIQEQAGRLEQTALVTVNASDNGAISQLNQRISGLGREAAVVEVPFNVTDNNSVEILEAKIFASAQRSRAAYLDTANAIASMGTNARSAFATNDELILFMEQVNKQFVIAGTEASGVKAAMLQLTQAMGSGVLRGEEYNSILEQAPNIIQNIASYIEGNEDVLAAVADAMDMKTEKLAGNVQRNLKDIASEGLISAEMVKAAMFAAADDTNARFESMPMTWAQIWTSMQNQGIKALDPVLQKINDIANSDRMQGFVDGMMDSFSMAVGLLGITLDLVAGVGAAVYDNWGWIEPVILGVAGAYLALQGAMLAYNAVQGISTALATAHAFAEQVKAAHTALAAGATFTETAAQYGLNAALLACPVTWVVIGIIALIAALYAAVGAVNHFAGTSISATGIIGGAFATLAAHIINTFFVPSWNAFAAIANFIGNVFNDPVAAVQVLFYDMALTVVGYIKNMAKAIEAVINKIPGVTVDITSGLDSFYSGLEEAQQKVKDESGWVEYVKKMDLIDYGDAASAGYSFGEGIEDSVSGLFKMPAMDDFGLDTSEFGNNLDGIFGNTGDTAANTAAAMDALDYAEEDLKYMRDIAEREAINRYTTAEITIEQHNENHIAKDTDLDGIMDAWANDFAEKMDVSGEGV